MARIRESGGKGVAPRERSVCGVSATHRRSGGGSGRAMPEPRTEFRRRSPSLVNLPPRTAVVRGVPGVPVRRERPGAPGARAGRPLHQGAAPRVLAVVVGGADRRRRAGDRTGP